MSDKTLRNWHSSGVVPESMRDVLLVAGRYDPPRPAQISEIPARIAKARLMNLNPTLCAFGPYEHACLLAAAECGASLRVGFENSWTASDGTQWADNAASVTALVAELRAGQRLSA